MKVLAKCKTRVSNKPKPMPIAHRTPPANSKPSGHINPANSKPSNHGHLINPPNLLSNSQLQPPLPNPPALFKTTALSRPLIKTLKKDKEYLAKTTLPIITVSASYKEDLKGLHGLPEKDTIQDVVFSRAHYSMALAIAIEAWGKTIDYQKAWLADPTNYVTSRDWQSIKLTQTIGEMLARKSFLKKLKDLADRFGRQKYPIAKSITPPLHYLSEEIDQPILSLHIASGNLLLENGKKVVQVITDPHVRMDYLKYAENPKLIYCVFDHKTRTELLEKAHLLGKIIDEKRVVVTGPPIDPRVVAVRKNKVAWRSGKLRLCLTTGGLGTNKTEIKQLLEQLLPLLNNPIHQQQLGLPPMQLIVYTATHLDLCRMVQKLAKQNNLKAYQPKLKDPANFRLNQSILPKKQEDKALNQQVIDSPLVILYHPQIVDANELLIRFGFPLADGFISKPSGDMAYDAVASGSFLLTLAEWGEWEHNIRQIFEQKDISRPAQISDIVSQLQVLSNCQHRSQSWVEQAMNNSLNIDPLFLNGSREIIKATKKAGLA